MPATSADSAVVTGSVSPPELLRSRRTLVLASSALAAAAGGGLLAVTYHISAAGGRPFLLLWVSLLLLFGPAVAILVGRDDTLRPAALMLLAATSSLPKVLRSPGRPVFSDEYAHLREVVNITEGWGLYVSNTLVLMASEFPGMHRAVASWSLALGSGTWVTAQTVVATAHASLLFAVFFLVRQFASSRSAGVATVLYASNPSFLLFSMQVAYESFALPLAVWSLAFALLSLKEPTRLRRLVWVGAALLLGAAVLVSHHLSALMLASTLLAVLVLELAYGAQGRRLALLAFAGVSGVAAYFWLAPVLAPLAAYLGPSLRLTTSQARRPFAGSGLPVLEQVAGVLLPFVVAVAAVWAVWRLWRSGARHLVPAPAVAVSSLTALLLVSFPLSLLDAAAEGARRSWGWTYLGFALLVALALDSPASLYRLRGGFTEPLRRAAIALAAFTLTVGGVAASQNELYRLPGPWLSGADARAAAPEVWAVVDALGSVAAPGDTLLADRYVRGPIVISLPVVALSPSPSWPVWDVVFEDELDPELLGRLSRAVRFVILDMRMADRAPAGGFWFNRHEPVGSVLSPYAAGRLDSVGVRVAHVGPYVVWDLWPARPEAPAALDSAADVALAGPSPQGARR